MLNNTEDINVTVAKQGEQLKQHSTDIAELKQLTRETLSSIKDFSERVTRLLTIQEQAHTPDSCSHGRALNEVFERLRFMETEMATTKMTITNMRELSDRVLKTEKQLEVIEDEKKVAEGSKKIVTWLIDGGIYKIALAIGILYIIFERISSKI